jgi:hypothetical protein
MRSSVDLREALVNGGWRQLETRRMSSRSFSQRGQDSFDKAMGTT